VFLPPFFPLLLRRVDFPAPDLFPPGRRGFLRPEG